MTTFDGRSLFRGRTLAALLAVYLVWGSTYLYNCPEYLESMFGLFKAALVPVNTNYRYSDDELVDAGDRPAGRQ